MSMLALLGWLGTALYLVNHAYLSLVRDWRPAIYYAGNLVAASALVISSLAIASWQAVCINAFWSLVSLLLLLKMDLSRVPGRKSWLQWAMALLLAWVVLSSIWQQQLNFGLLGWSSTLAFCGGYLLFSAGRLPIQNYLFWNTYAALALLPQLWLHGNWPVFALEAVWSLLSLYGLARKMAEAHLID